MTSMDGPMTGAERAALLKVIEERKTQLAEKRKELEALTAGHQIPSAATDTQANALLQSVLESIKEAHRRPLEKLPDTTQPTPSSPASPKAVQELTKPPIGVTEPKLRYSKALRKVVGALGAQSKAVNVLITPKTIDRFEKSIQSSSGFPLNVPQQTDVGASVRRTTKVGGDHPVLPNKGVISATDIKGTPAKPKSSPEPEKQTWAEPSELSEEAKKKLLYSGDFDAFFTEAARTVERTLGEDEMFEGFAECTRKDKNEETPDLAGERLKTLLSSYTDQRWSQNRPLTDLRSHTKFRETFLGAYGSKSNASQIDPEGCVLIWNVALPGRPEYAFSSSSPVCTALFDTYRPQIVLGGTYTGSLALWDSRASVRPVQKTLLSSKSHRQPVYALSLVGTEHAHTLVSVDGDGRLCLWSLAMLSQPTETLDLKSNGRDIRCTAIDFAVDESNAFIGGGGDGDLFQVQVHGKKAGANETFPGHLAPVTGVEWHPAVTEGDAALNDLLLSSSFDWSIKLWTPKSRLTPLHSFDAFDDYVTSVKWHPLNPGVFGCSTADGKLHIWDMAQDDEIPGYSRQSATTEALMKIDWSIDGQRLMAGDTTGVIQMWAAKSELCYPRQDDLTKLSAVIDEMKTSDRTRDVS